MKTLFSILFVCLFSFNSFGQDKDKRVSTGFEFSVWNSQQLFDDNADIESENQFGGSLAATVFYDLNARIQLQSGVRFGWYRISETDFSPSFACDQDGTGGVNIKNSFFQIDYDLLYLGIPLESRIKLFGEENHFYGVAGVELLLNISSDGEVSLYECGENPRVLDNPIFTANSWGLDLRLGTGYEFKLNKVKFYIEPQAELWLTKVFEKRPTLISADAINNSRLLSFAITAGLRF